MDQDTNLVFAQMLGLISKHKQWIREDLTINQRNELIYLLDQLKARIREEEKIELCNVTYNNIDIETSLVDLVIPKNLLLKIN